MFCRTRFVAFVVATVCITSDVSAFAPLKTGKTQLQKIKCNVSNSVKSVSSFALVASICVSLVDPALASSQTAAQIQINSVPPENIQISIADLPVVGKLLSGTYARFDTGAYNAAGSALGGNPKQSSVLIRSPSDKAAAIKDLATKGHLEFDIEGVIEAHVNIDAATLKAGELTVKIKSPLIPSLPFKNEINEVPKIKGGRTSDWTEVTNLGDGSQFYQNLKTGTKQSEKPTKFN